MAVIEYVERTDHHRLERPGSRLDQHHRHRGMSQEVPFIGRTDHAGNPVAERLLLAGCPQDQIRIHVLGRVYCRFPGSRVPHGRRLEMFELTPRLLQFVFERRLRRLENKGLQPGRVFHRRGADIGYAFVDDVHHVHAGIVCSKSSGFFPSGRVRTVHRPQPRADF